jgi:adenylylsulfate kinase
MPAVLLAGLPGSGKSVMASQLAQRLGGHVLNKDLVREAMFGPDRVAYSVEQDDLVHAWMLDAARSLWEKDPELWLMFDGRAYSRAYQREQVLSACQQQGQRLVQVYCHCSEETARKRMARPHLAKNRNWDLWLKLRREFEPIENPDITVDSDEPLANGLEQVLTCLGAGE